MDTLTPKISSTDSSSSNSSSASPCMDKKLNKKSQRDHKLTNSRSRSFLHCIGKRLGKHFMHHHPHDAIFNSQDDLRSSSTDSFSLSFERGSHLECHVTGSSLDLTSEEPNSRTSSASACSRLSPVLCPLDLDELDSYRYNNQHHFYVETMYRPNSAFEHNNNGSLSSDDDDENVPEEQNTNSVTASNTPRSVSTAASKGLHLSRISISSSVRSMFHHFSSTASTRSLSCSSTPLRRISDTSSKKQIVKSKKSTASTISAPANTNRDSKKKEKKQQSILRPPINYVYMKGMSGLYSRVPRYTVCCPYAMQQIA